MPQDITCMWNLKYGSGEPISETDMESQAQNRLMVTRGRGWGKDGLGVWG